MRCPVLVLALCLTWTANAQQSGKAVPASKRTTTQTTPASNTAALVDDSATPNVPIPVYGTGTTNFIPLWTGSHRIGNSLVSKTGNRLNLTGTLNASAFAGGEGNNAACLHRWEEVTRTRPAAAR
jgi:hypothetical protein